MWDKPELLRMISNFLFGISFALLSYAILHYVLHLPVLAMRFVSINSPLVQVDPAHLKNIVQNKLHGNFFTLDLKDTQKNLESIPWVRKVNIRRSFPWHLEITLEEHVALAYWNNADLVNTHGEIFSASTNQMLPNFMGQPNDATEITEMYATLNKQFTKLGRGIAEISLSPRRSWRLSLDNGLLLELGREQSTQRIAQFISLYPYTLMQVQQETGHPTKNQNVQPRKITYVDLRYRNGFAIHLAEATDSLYVGNKKVKKKTKDSIGNIS